MVNTNYQSLISEMGNQIALRKWDLIKRSILISIPFLSFIIVTFILFKFSYFGTEEEIKSGMIDKVHLIYVGIFFVFCGVVDFVLRATFYVEKLIWINSFFDDKKLTLGQSWSISKKMLWSFVFFRFYLICKYYLVPILIYIVASVILGIFIHLGVVILLILALPIIVLIYGYFYLRIKLRFGPFVFLQKYGLGLNYSSLVSEMEKLNDFAGSESYKKALVTNMGTDSLTVITNTVVNSMTSGLSAFKSESLGVIGGVIGSVVKETSSQALKFANLTVVYILYIQAKEIAGIDKTANENIYKILQ
ncbi:MAG: hypothetical protein WCF94_04525 [bacterium]